jgi:hypothetical protein
MFIRNVKDFWTGIIYIVFGTAALVIARDYSLGTALKMGPAYFPSILSVLLIVIGGISLVRSLIKPGSPFGSFTFKGVLLVIAATFIFGLTVKGAGLIIALPALVIISSLASDKFSWRYSLLFAAGLTLFCVLIFVKGLGIPLPILGSWFGS